MPVSEVPVWRSAAGDWTRALNKKMIAVQEAAVKAVVGDFMSCLSCV
jgi:hypothetical protein